MKRFRYDKYIVMAGILALVVASYLADLSHQNRVQDGNPRVVQISDRRTDHILYGDERGGGHLYGVGRPCKSEFPQSWNDDKIITTTKRIAANDNISWNQENNGYYVGEQMIEGVNVRVVLDGEKDDVVTAYPLNMPRNPCKQ